MSHDLEVRDMDSYFIIDPYSRSITKETDSDDEVVQYDHNSERFTFKIPKIVEGHDMSTCNCIEVHYINTSSGTSVSTRSSNADIYIVNDLIEDPTDDESLIFTWLLSQNGTQFAGNIKFQIHFKCYGDGGSENPDYIWNTQIYSSAIKVLEGYDCAVLIPELNPDAIQRFEQRIKALEENMGKYWTDEGKTEIVNAVLEALPAAEDLEFLQAAEEVTL